MSWIDTSVLLPCNWCRSLNVAVCYTQLHLKNKQSLLLTSLTGKHHGVAAPIVCANSLPHTVYHLGCWGVNFLRTRFFIGYVLWGQCLSRFYSTFFCNPSLAGTIPDKGGQLGEGGRATRESNQMRLLDRTVTSRLLDRFLLSSCE